MICSSLNRLFFISVSFRRSPIQTEGASGGNINSTDQTGICGGMETIVAR
jgi:hypothetical protein